MNKKLYTIIVLLIGLTVDPYGFAKGQKNQHNNSRAHHTQQHKQTPSKPNSSASRQSAHHTTSKQSHNNPSKKSNRKPQSNNTYHNKGTSTHHTYNNKRSRNYSRNSQVTNLQRRMASVKNKTAAKSLSPNKTFSKARYTHGFTQQKSFMNHNFHGHNWGWWWHKNPYFFYSYFPSYFNSTYGYYPPIYYDFHDAYGFYPTQQTYMPQVYPSGSITGDSYEDDEDDYEPEYDSNFVENDNIRICVQDYLNTTDYSLQECLDKCGYR
jgi:hypothetical protein